MKRINLFIVLFGVSSPIFGMLVPRIPRSSVPQQRFNIQRAALAQQQRRLMATKPITETRSNEKAKYPYLRLLGKDSKTCTICEGLRKAWFYKGNTEKNCDRLEEGLEKAIKTGELPIPPKQNITSFSGAGIELFAGLASGLWEAASGTGGFQYQQALNEVLKNHGSNNDTEFDKYRSLGEQLSLKYKKQQNLESQKRWLQKE